MPVGTTERIEVAGRRLNVWRAGERGPVVVLVHGIPTNHLLWHDVVLGLHDRAQIMAVDMLGYGWSDPPQGRRVDIAAQASYVLGLLDVLGIDEAVVVGHDLGGGVAQLLATTSGDRIRGIGIVDGVTFDGWPVPVFAVMKALWPLVGAMPAPLLTAGLDRVLRSLFVHKDRAALYAPWFTAPWGRPGASALLTRHLRALNPGLTQAITPFLPRLSMPVEVVWGRQDSEMKPKYGERLLDAIPSAHLTWVDAHHFVPADTPVPVIEAILRLLERVGTDPRD
ncbi:alpha/beta hydrolase [Nesterenkonia lutea]